MVNAVAVGVGVTIGALAVIAVILVIIGICTSSRRMQDLESEMERRRQQLNERHQQEQEQWRNRRLRDVVRLLIDRGVAEEGIPLAFQMPNHREVCARRELRHARRTERQRLEDELANNESEPPVLDVQGRNVARMSLDELLAEGRPAEAEPGPDVMQLLLDGQELHQDSDEEAESSSSFETETNESPQTPLPPVPSSAATYSPPENNPPDSRPNDESPRAPEPATTSGAPPSGTSPSPPPAAGGSSVSPHAEEDSATRERRRQEEREAAIIREIKAEQRRRKRPRKTPEEVYGDGFEYVPNPNNEAFGYAQDFNGSFSQNQQQQPMSPLRRFFSTPLTPFKKRGGRTSAFEGRTPTSTTAGSPRYPRRASDSVGPGANASTSVRVDVRSPKKGQAGAADTTTATTAAESPKKKGKHPPPAPLQQPQQASGSEPF